MIINKKRKKIIKYKQFSFLNIGTVLFGILFIYMIICLILYLATPHVTAYEVTAGNLSGNFRYTALALKKERIVHAEHGGNITYYAREGSKMGKGSNVYSIDESKKAPSSVKKEDVPVSEEVDAKVITKLRNQMASYAANYDPMNFQNIYNFKADMETNILEITMEEELGYSDSIPTAYGLMSLNETPQEGIVIYSEDGYEELTLETLKLADFEEKDYHKKNLRLNETVATGDPVYKLITDENWSLVIPLDKKMATELADNDTVRFRFLKDGTAFNAGFSIQQNGSDYYGKLDIAHSVVRFAGDRFIDIELMLNHKSGLKIPNSAVAEKVFYVIPKEFAIYDENDSPNEIGILKETSDKDGTSTKYITATVYDKTDKIFLVDMELFKKGDTILMKDSAKKFQIGETKAMEGVYNMNKGYAIFREITIIDENEVYCIVKDGAAFGLSQYDHIVLDASTVNEEEILY